MSRIGKPSRMFSVSSSTTPPDDGSGIETMSIAAIAAAHRRADHGLIGFEIVRRHDAAGVADRLRQLFRDRPFVESARPLLGNRRQRCRQIGLDQPVAFAQRGAVGAGKDLSPMRPARQPPVPCPAACRRVSSATTKPSRASSIAGCSRSRQREFARAVFLQRQRQPGDRAGHADAERGIARLCDIGLAVGAREKYRAWSRPARSRDSRWRCPRCARPNGSP